MFGILGFILIFVFFVLLIVFALVSKVLRFIFGFGQRTPKYYNEQRVNQEDNIHSSTTSSAFSASKKKIFDEDEGEYVEFEEVK